MFIDKILPGSEADRLKKAGKVSEGDEVVMVSATFGEEMWSARGVGKYRLEKSIAVRQGNGVSFVLESSTDQSKKRRDAAKKFQEKEQERTNRLQKMLADEVESDKKKNKLFGLF